MWGSTKEQRTNDGGGQGWGHENDNDSNHGGHLWRACQLQVLSRHRAWTWVRVCQVQKGEQFGQGEDVSEGMEEEGPLQATEVGSGRGQARGCTLASGAKLRSLGKALSTSDVWDTHQVPGPTQHGPPLALPQPVGNAGHSSSWMRDLRPALST